MKLRTLISFLVLACSMQLTFCSCMGQGLVINESAEGVEIIENSRKVLFFQKKPKAVNGQFERAGYVHPLYDLDGNVITEDAPEDHPYHRGIFWAWHQVVWQNKKIADGWISENISFQPVGVSSVVMNNEASIRSEMIWTYRKEGTDTLNIMRENTVIRVHGLTTTYRLVDFDIHLVPLVDSLALGGADDVKGYGGFSMRWKLPGDIKFFSGEKEVVAKETAVASGPWMDFTGSFGKSKTNYSGITAFSHSPFPGPFQNWILRTEKSMQNIPFPGSKPKLLPQEGWHLKYRLVIHSGLIGNKKLDQLYQEYAGKN